MGHKVTCYKQTEGKKQSPHCTLWIANVEGDDQDAIHGSVVRSMYLECVLGEGGVASARIVPAVKHDDGQWRGVWGSIEHRGLYVDTCKCISRLLIEKFGKDIAIPARIPVFTLYGHP